MWNFIWFQTSLSLYSLVKLVVWFSLCTFLTNIRFKLTLNTSTIRFLLKFITNVSIIIFFTKCIPNLCVIPVLNSEVFLPFPTSFKFFLPFHSSSAEVRWVGFKPWCYQLTLDTCEWRWLTILRLRLTNQGVGWLPERGFHFFARPNTACSIIYGRRNRFIRRMILIYDASQIIKADNRRLCKFIGSCYVYCTNWKRIMNEGNLYLLHYVCVDISRYFIALFFSSSFISTLTITIQYND